MRVRSLPLLTLVISVLANFQTDVVHSASQIHHCAAKMPSLDEVKKAAFELNKQPVDAKISRAGKANVIPELNGIEVDLKATWEQLAGRPAGSPVPYVFRQVPPKVRMQDLPPMPIYQGNPEKKEMALMVNVAWGTEYLEGFLEVFRENRIKGTFFLDGSWLEKNQEIAKKIVAEGHEIGNHAYTHPNMARLTEAQQRQQIVKTQGSIQQKLGVQSRWFAPPSGSYNDKTVLIAKEAGMGTVLWTLDTVDWKRPPKEVIRNRIVPHARNGAMVLMHPTEPTLSALRTLIPELKKKGFRLVTVSDLLSPVRDPYQ